VKRNFILALETGKHYVLYYHGHGHQDAERRGDWCIPGGELSFGELVGLLTTTRTRVKPQSQIVVYVICDCCFSGNWVDEWTKVEPVTRSLLRIIASCDRTSCCYDGNFPKVFFKQELPFTDWEISGMAEDVVRSEIRSRVFDQAGVERGKPAPGTHYTRTDLGKMRVDVARQWLKDFLRVSAHDGQLAFLREHPLYCTYYIQESDCQSFWFRDGLMEGRCDKRCNELSA
jgi:hypothetical protein